MATLNYLIHPGVFELAPDFLRGVVIARGIDNSTADDRLQTLLREQISSAEADADRTIADSRITAWESIYTQFPVPRGERIRPSHATLLRRIKKGDGGKIPFISPLVAISNMIAVKYMVPSGVFDLQRISGNLVLSAATGDENFLPFGKETPTPVLPGEIVLKDERAVVCRAWNSRGGQATAISDGTQEAIIDIDSLSRVISKATLHKAVTEAAALVSDFCGGTVNVYYLDAVAPTAEM